MQYFFFTKNLSRRVNPSIHRTRINHQILKILNISPALYPRIPNHVVLPRFPDPERFPHLVDIVTFSRKLGHPSVGIKRRKIINAINHHGGGPPSGVLLPTSCGWTKNSENAVVRIFLAFFFNAPGPFGQLEPKLSCGIGENVEPKAHSEGSSRNRFLLGDFFLLGLVADEVEADVFIRKCVVNTVVKSL